MSIWIKDVNVANCCPWVMFTLRPISVMGEESIPLPFRLVTCCALTDSFGGLKERGRRCKIRHARKEVSSISQVRRCGLSCPMSHVTSYRAAGHFYSSEGCYVSRFYSNESCNVTDVPLIKLHILACNDTCSNIYIVEAKNTAYNLLHHPAMELKISSYLRQTEVSKDKNIT